MVKNTKCVQHTAVPNAGIENFYTKIKTKEAFNPNYSKKHYIKLPMRLLICGGSGSGKSNTLLNILRAMDSTFHEVVFCLKSKKEPLYEYVEAKNKSILFYENEVPDLDTLFEKDETNKLIVFDDMVREKTINKNIEDYFLRARKYNVSCVYLSQSYYSTSKFIRQNCNYVILMNGLLNRDLRLIISEYNFGIDQKQFETLYKSETKTPLSFILIDLFGTHPQNLRIAKGLMHYYRSP